MKNLSCCRGFGITGFPNLVPWLCYCCIIMFADLWSFFSLKLSGWRSRWQRGGGRSDARVRPLSLPSSKVPMTAGPQWMDSFPSWVWGAANCQADQLFPAHSVPEQAGVTLQHCRGTWHGSCWCWSPPAARQTWILLLPFCSSKWTHCLLIYLYQLVW